MAGVTGLEPAASGVTGRRSNQLSYTRNPCYRPFGRLLTVPPTAAAPPLVAAVKNEGGSSRRTAPCQCAHFRKVTRQPLGSDRAAGIGLLTAPLAPVSNGAAGAGRRVVRRRAPCPRECRAVQSHRDRRTGSCSPRRPAPAVRQHRDHPDRGRD